MLVPVCWARDPLLKTIFGILVAQIVLEKLFLDRFIVYSEREIRQKATSKVLFLLVKEW